MPKKGERKLHNVSKTKTVQKVAKRIPVSELMRIMNITSRSRIQRILEGKEAPTERHILRIGEERETTTRIYRTEIFETNYFPLDPSDAVLNSIAEFVYDAYDYMIAEFSKFLRERQRKGKRTLINWIGIGAHLLVGTERPSSIESATDTSLIRATTKMYYPYSSESVDNIIEQLIGFLTEIPIIGSGDGIYVEEEPPQLGPIYITISFFGLFSPVAH